MDPTPSPTVINVDFQAKPADAVEGPFPPDLHPARPVPFRKRTSFLPVRFFSAKRLPPGTPTDPESGEPAEEAIESPEAAAAGAPARLILPPLPAEVPSAPFEPAPVQAAELSDSPPPPEAGPPPDPAVTPAEVAEELPEPPPGVPADLTQLPTPAADAAPRSDARGAAVQLTLGCEVAALRLTPAFRLGSAQLRVLSDVVALRFIAPGEAGNPLAAAVACQIVHVELDPVSGRLKNLLLKPLDEPRDPLPPHPLAGRRAGPGPRRRRRRPPRADHRHGRAADLDHGAALWDVHPGQHPLHPGLRRRHAPAGSRLGHRARAPHPLDPAHRAGPAAVLRPDGSGT